jgi:hypothetical protein
MKWTYTPEFATATGKEFDYGIRRLTGKYQFHIWLKKGATEACLFVNELSTAKEIAELLEKDWRAK